MTEATGEGNWRLLTEDGTHGYRLVFVGGHTIELHRVGTNDERPLRKWPLPQDGAERLAHRFEVLVDRRTDDGAATEITLRRDGAYFGLGIDVGAPATPLHSIVEGKGASLRTETLAP